MSRFEIFLRDLQSRLNSRLNPTYRRLWVQGNNKNGKMSFVMTLFHGNTYTMEFFNDTNISLDIKSESYLKYVDKLVERYSSYFRPE